MAKHAARATVARLEKTTCESRRRWYAEVVMRRFAILVTLVIGCGPPVARNLPKPNTAAAAGIAAGAAAAITLADPNAQAKRVEANKVEDEQRPQQVKSTVPPDVFDRLDAQQRPQPAVPVAPASAPGEP